VPEYEGKKIVMLRKYAVLLMLLLASAGALADPPAGYPFVSYDEGMRVAKVQNKRVFLYFGRLGCAWCDIVNKQAFVDPKLKELYTKNYVLIYVDSESGKRLRLPSGERITEADLGVHYQVFGSPVFIYIEPDGKKIASAPGVQTLKNLLDYDRFVMEGHYHKQSLAEFLKGNP
jgi:thioredoxin-related protein